MENDLTYQTVITILTAIITGGFVLILVENGNRKNRDNDRYDYCITPFMLKFSAYLRYIHLCHHYLKFPHEKDEYMQQFHNHLIKLSNIITHFWLYPRKVVFALPSTAPAP